MDKPSPWTEPRVAFDVALLRLYFAARAVRDGFAPQSQLSSALDIAERCEDLWLAALEPKPDPEPTPALSAPVVDLPF